jgi:peptide-methionine (S)-S-oxide reductase
MTAKLIVGAIGLGLLSVAVTRSFGALFGAAPSGSAGYGLTPRGYYRTKQAPKELPPTEVAAFAAGCFWGVEGEFRKEPGVVATAVGFSGGHTENPSYPQVCTGRTGHAETVMVEYDPRKTTYAHLLDVFWNLHDPTTKNRQGPDVGEQYRSIVFTFTPEQKTEALASRDRLQHSGELSAPIVTEILLAMPFYPAEAYHQQYVEKGGIASCHVRRKTPPNEAPAP